MRLTKAAETLVAKFATSPRTPTQTHDPLTTLGTEIWTVTREERQDGRIIWQLCRGGTPWPPLS